MDMLSINTDDDLSDEKKMVAFGKNWLFEAIYDINKLFFRFLFFSPPERTDRFGELMKNYKTV